jgi:hypothetical protein
VKKIKLSFSIFLFLFLFLQGIWLPDSSAQSISEGEPDISDFEVSLPNPISDLYQEFQQIVGVVDTFLADLGIEVDTGDLGIPDIEQAAELFEEDNQIDVAGDVFGTQTGGTITSKEKLLQQYQKELSSEYARNTALSTEGQQKIADKVELAGDTVEASQELASDSDSQDVSQNILRNISRQAALQQQLDNMILFELQEDKVSRALNAEMQGQSLLELSRQSTRSERETENLYKTGLYNQGLISIPGQHLIE